MRFFSGSCSKSNEEIKRKLRALYSEPMTSHRRVVDFDKGYDFFSENEAQMMKYSSRWFNPEKYEQRGVHEVSQVRCSQEDGVPSQALKVSCDEAACRSGPKSECALKMDRLRCSASQVTRDLEKLGRTPYHIGMEGEKFRVVAATLQKCNSPFVRRTFQFTSNGIIETPEGREDGENMKILPVINQSKKGVTQKLVTIRRFRVIKKDNLGGDKCLVPQTVSIANEEKARFLTVRIRSKERQSHGGTDAKKKCDASATPEVVRLTSSTEEEDCDSTEKGASPCTQTEETDDGEEFVTKSTAEEEEATPEPEHKDSGKQTQVKKVDREEFDSNDTDENSVDYEDFSSYQSCLAQVRSQQRQTCQLCSKRVPTSKQLREHMRAHHLHQRYTRSGGAAEDRIKTATSKFGRTRRVLNIAGLRSKYKML